MPNFNGMVNGRPVEMPSIHTKFKHCIRIELPTIETIMETSPQQQEEEEHELQAPVIIKLAQEMFSHANNKAKKIYSNWENFERINPNAARSYRIKAERQNQEALEEIATEETRLAHQAEILSQRIEKEIRWEEDKKRRLEEARRISSIRWNHQNQPQMGHKAKDGDVEEDMGWSSGGGEGMKGDGEGENEGVVKDEIKRWQERALLGDGMDVADMTHIMSVVQLEKRN